MFDHLLVFFFYCVSTFCFFGFLRFFFFNSCPALSLSFLIDCKKSHVWDFNRMLERNCRQSRSVLKVSPFFQIFIFILLVVPFRFNSYRSRSHKYRFKWNTREKLSFDREFLLFVSIFQFL